MSSVTEEHIDIYYQGYIFRFEIFYPREVLLLDKLIINRNSTDAVNEKRIHTIDRPSLAGLMHSLHLKHSSFGLATRYVLPRQRVVFMNPLTVHAALPSDG